LDLAFPSAADLFDVLKELATETIFVFSSKYFQLDFHLDYCMDFKIKAKILKKICSKILGGILIFVSLVPRSEGLARRPKGKPNLEKIFSLHNS
jgi:hypothetical protein